MSPVTRSLRTSTRSYISQFTPQSSQAVVDISDDETVPMDEEDPVRVTEVDEDVENWMDSPAAILVAPLAPTPPASSVAPAAPAVPEVVSPDGPKKTQDGLPLSTTSILHRQLTSATCLGRCWIPTMQTRRLASGTAVQSTHTPMRPPIGG